MPGASGRTLLAGGLALWLGGCIGITLTQTQPAPEPKTPPRFVADAPPELEPTQFPGILAAPSLDRLYYEESSDQWYRWAMNRWYVAFGWDGAWFPLLENEVTQELRALHSPPTAKSRKQKLEELERQLEELEELETEPGAEPEALSRTR